MCKCGSIEMTDTTFVVLQTTAYSVQLQGFYSEIHPASPHDECQAVSVKTEETSAAEREEDPVPIISSGLKADAEVSCVYVFMLDRFHMYGYLSF
jgi:hypothetical protein